MDGKAFVRDTSALAAVALSLLAANVGMMDHAAVWLVIAFAIGWLVEPLVTKIDPFWPPAFYGATSEEQ